MTLTIKLIICHQDKVLSYDVTYINGNLQRPQMHSWIYTMYSFCHDLLFTIL